MKLHHLRVLVSVIEQRGVSKAATRLNISQPAASSAMKSLEDELDVVLFERFRGGRSNQPTAAALKFYAHACDILKRCDEAKNSVQATDDRPPKIRLGALDTLSANHIAQLQTALDEGSEAKVRRWSVQEGSEVKLSNDLKQQRIDIAWTVVDESQPRTRAMWREPFVAMVAKDHRLARSEKLVIHIKDLQDEPIVLRGKCELPHNSFQDVGLTVKPAAHAERDELALAFVAHGIGYAIAPRSLATSDVVALSVVDMRLSRLIGLKWGRAGLSDSIDALAGILAGRP